MHSELAAFFRSPGSRTYRAARKIVLAEPAFSQAGRRIARLASLVSQGQKRKALSLGRKTLRETGLSPRMHRLMAIAAAEIAFSPSKSRGATAPVREAAADLELHRFGYDACLAGLLATGDGTPAKPYLVAYTSDAHEIAIARGFRVEGQQVVQRGRKTYDVLEVVPAAGESNDRRQWWFDVTDLMPKMPVLRRRRMATPAK